MKRYIREVYPLKSPRTRKDNDKELVNLVRVFGHMPIDLIAPMHIREYMTFAARTPRSAPTARKRSSPTSSTRPASGDTQLRRTLAKG